MGSFRSNPAGIRQIAASEDMQRALRVYAEKVRIAVEANDPPVDTGQYAYDIATPPGEQGGFEVSTGVRDGHAFARVTALAPHSSYLEFGTRYMEAQRPLGKALDAIKGTP